MRQIKFRAWNGERMMYRELCDRNWYSSPLDSGKCIRGAIPNDKREVKIMQFTGLRDYNGDDIYEGDIVDCSTSSLLGEVEQQCTMVASFDYGDLVALHCSDQQFVIGNIHQNPELLK